MKVQGRQLYLSNIPGRPPKQKKLGRGTRQLVFAVTDTAPSYGYNFPVPIIGRIILVSIAVVLAAVTYFAAGIWWQLWKRRAFLKSAIADESLLYRIISKDSLLKPQEQIAVYAHKGEWGYIPLLSKLAEDLARRC